MQHKVIWPCEYSAQWIQLEENEACEMNDLESLFYQILEFYSLCRAKGQD